MRRLIQMFQNALEVKETNPQVWNQIGEDLAKQGLWDKAEMSFRQAIALKPDDSEAWSNLAQTLIHLKRFQEALASCHQALKLNPNLASAYNNLALGLLHQQKLSEAEEACNNALKLVSGYPEALITLGMIRTLQKRLDEAEALFGQVLYIKPDLVEAYGNRAQVHFEKNCLDEALADITQLEGFKPWLSGLYVIKACILKAKGDLKGAKQAFECVKVLEKAPWSAQTHKELGNTLVNHRKLDQAMAIYHRALAINPNFAEVYNNLGTLLVCQNKPNEAIAYYHHSLLLKEDLFQAHYNLGNLFKDSGQWQEAATAFQKVLAIKPDHIEAHQELAFVLLRQNRVDEAVTLSKKALALDPECEEAKLKLAAAYQAQGQYSQTQTILYDIFFQHHGLSPEKMARFEPMDITDDQSIPKTAVTPFKLVDCINQLNYLIDKEKIDPSFKELVARYQALLPEIEAKSFDDAYVGTLLSPEQVKSLGGYYDKIIYYPGTPPLRGPALNDSLDYKVIEDSYLGSSMVYFDNFLTPEALQNLRQFCLESTIFFKHRASGYVGAYMTTGIANPLMFQIAEELRERLPRVLGELSVGNMWVYRYQSQGQGVKPHTGDGSVTLNFWFTPDESNLGPKEGGGLVIWDKKQVPQSTSSWSKFNTGKDDPQIQEKISQFLSSAKSTTIPYRCNRAVIFHSTLWHRSDPFHFRDQFEHRRMNGTMLFGNRSISNFYE
ncbi:tetratricopeptide repeat protein [Cyanothece sp. BG0011]|uniref:tetratricopeptide repeat protein n=1 Tax=Cyanothece sp. BG0011 TaxID=2082950 RepID=UPI0018E573A1|nr:tetratricopeptide repeat protein [Cyanothece sp. BG0011]